MVTGLVKAAASIQLSIVMHMHDRWHLPGTSEGLSSVLDEYMQLLPHVRALEEKVRCGNMQSTHYPQLRPWVEGINGLSRLRELRVHADVVRLRRTVLNVFFNRATCLTSLVQSNWSVRGWRCEWLSFGGFVVGLCGLTGLTCLQFDFGQSPSGECMQFLDACSALSILESISLGTFSLWGRVSSSSLTQLRRKELRVRAGPLPRRQLNMHPESVDEGLFSVVNRMQHLRCIGLPDQSDIVPVHEFARQRLPAFQCTCDVLDDCSGLAR